MPHMKRNIARIAMLAVVVAAGALAGCATVPGGDHSISFIAHASDYEDKVWRMGVPIGA